jgi:hypothetical protein
MNMICIILSAMFLVFVVSVVYILYESELMIDEEKENKYDR